MFDSKLPISYYEEIGVLSEEHKITIVQHRETAKVYLKKVTSDYDINVYKFLYYNPVKYVPRIYALYEEAGELTIIEEYISGDTIQEIIDICHCLPEEQIIEYTIQLCQILKAFHNHEPAIIHRDIKASNIIITESGNVMLLDLGTAKIYKPGKRRDTVMLGTEEYAAPEQFGFAQSTPQTDIYAIGILINTMLTGNTEIQDDLKGRLKTVIDKATKLSPAERYPSLDSLIKALESI